MLVVETVVEVADVEVVELAELVDADVVLVVDSVRDRKDPVLVGVGPRRVTVLEAVIVEHAQGHAAAASGFAQFAMPHQAGPQGSRAGHEHAHSMATGSAQVMGPAPSASLGHHDGSHSVVVVDAVEVAVREDVSEEVDVDVAVAQVHAQASASVALPQSAADSHQPGSHDVVVVDVSVVLAHAQRHVSIAWLREQFA